jgi:hypothetical protein
LPKEITVPDLDLPADPVSPRQRALARWDNEGGALAAVTDVAKAHGHEMTNAELVQLRIRVIALENLVTAILAAGSDAQIQVARNMAAYISPRPGATPHPLTVSAAHNRTELVERAIYFRSEEPT